MFITKIKVGSLEYDVYQVPQTEFPLTRGNIKVFGSTDYVDRTIHVLETLKQEQWQRVVIHELTHAFVWSFIPNTKVDEEFMADFIGIYGFDIFNALNEIESELDNIERRKTL